jgi:hypothetical protein
MAEKKDPWPEFTARAKKILAEVVTAEVAGELAPLLSEVADKLRPALNVQYSWPPATATTTTSGWPAAWHMPVTPAAEKADPGELSDDEKQVIWDQFLKGELCPHCGGSHLRACPRVKRMVFHGTEISEVEFWAHGSWPETDIIFPESVAPEGEG